MLPYRRYRKPPLIEVFSDFYFDMGDDREWDPKRLSSFTEKIRTFGYPVEGNVPGRGPSRPRGGFPHGQKTANWPWRHRFASDDGNRTAQVGENLLVINQFPPYYGWQLFKQQALECFGIYQSIWPSERIIHSGLHYVDVVKVPGDSFFIDDYFNM
ncbi:MAG: TIGR04255 family protein, partial [Isosphaerales bacterium]